MRGKNNEIERKKMLEEKKKGRGKGKKLSSGQICILMSGKGRKIYWNTTKNIHSHFQIGANRQTNMRSNNDSYLIWTTGKQKLEDLNLTFMKGQTIWNIVGGCLWKAKVFFPSKYHSQRKQMMYGCHQYHITNSCTFRNVAWMYKEKTIRFEERLQ